VDIVLAGIAAPYDYDVTPLVTAAEFYGRHVEKERKKSGVSGAS
jgi:hypothetical protein